MKIAKNKIGPEEAKSLCHLNSSLTTLFIGDFHDADFEGYEITVKVILHSIQFNNTLTSLNLAGSKIRDTWVELISISMQYNSTLTTLHLNRNKIGPIGANSISNFLQLNSTLLTLNLDDNKISYEGVKLIATALKTNYTLKALHLKTNRINLAGVASIARALLYNTSLTYLSLNKNGISSHGATALWGALKSGNTTLTKLKILFDDNINCDVYLEDCIQKNKNLKNVSLWPKSHHCLSKSNQKMMEEMLLTMKAIRIPKDVLIHQLRIILRIFFCVKW
uniref:Uncharacterized protein n=1 Tax=Arcella intermedia TaxID=1963864 RepID=A0A6B2LDD8_9EUKA